MFLLFEKLIEKMNYFLFLLFIFNFIKFNLSLKIKNDHKQILINFNSINQIKSNDYSKLMFLTIPEYRKYASSPPGQEHYALLSYFAIIFSKNPYSYIDIGTRFGTSALTMATYGHHVITYDIPGSTELETALKSMKMTKENWDLELKKLNCNITTISANLLKVTDEEFEPVRRAPFILLDTYHRPYSNPFEREFIERLVASKYNGVVILDDIFEDREMIEWFNELICSKYRPFSVYNITSVGHASGTGLLDFGSKLRFIGKGTESILKSSSDPLCLCGKYEIKNQ